MDQQLEQQLKAHGMQQHEVDQARAMGLDFGKLIALIRTILGLFGGGGFQQQTPVQTKP